MDRLLLFSSTSVVLLASLLVRSSLMGVPAGNVLLLL